MSFGLVTLVHVLLSLAGIAAGFVVVLKRQRQVSSLWPSASRL
jgi:hypothetical protein